MNLQKDLKVKFNLINLYKDKSLYEKGMKPCVFSEKLHALKGERWHRAGEYVTYQKNENYKKFNLCPTLVSVQNMQGKKQELQTLFSVNDLQKQKKQKPSTQLTAQQQQLLLQQPPPQQPGGQKGENNLLYYYTISFVYIFRQAFDTVYFSNCYPYTYSDLQNYLGRLKLKGQARGGNASLPQSQTKSRTMFRNESQNTERTALGHPKCTLE